MSAVAGSKARLIAGDRHRRSARQPAATWATATAELAAEWSKLEAWIATRRGLGFTVNGVELSGEHVLWLADDVRERIAQLKRERNPEEAWALADSALLYAEVLRAMLTGVEVPDPSGMRQAARRAYTVARMLRELVWALDAAGGRAVEADVAS